MVKVASFKEIQKSDNEEGLNYYLVKKNIKARIEASRRKLNFEIFDA